jgi:hypothetical protein
LPLRNIKGPSYPKYPKKQGIAKVQRRVRLWHKGDIPPSSKARNTPVVLHPDNGPPVFLRLIVRSLVPDKAGSTSEREPACAFDGTRDEIVRLAAQAEELAARIESCRKFILAGWVAIVAAGLVLLAMLLGLIGSDPSVLGPAVAAVLGGIVAAGSNRSTAKEASMELSGTGEAG